MSDLPTPPGGSPISAKTRVSLTLPQLFAVIAVVVGGCLGWSRLDVRLGRIETRLGIVEDNQHEPVRHSAPSMGALILNDNNQEK